MSDPPHWFTWLADVSSCLGLIVTGLLTAGAWQVRKLLFIYPKHATKLEDHCSLITDCLNDFAANQNRLGQEIGKLRGDLNSLRPYIWWSWSRRRTLNSIVNKMSEYEKLPGEREARTLLNSMYQLLAEMQNLAQGL